MWDTSHDIINALWPLLPQLTIGLRFCAALIGLGLAISLDPSEGIDPSVSLSA